MYRGVETCRAIICALLVFLILDPVSSSSLLDAYCHTCTSMDASVYCSGKYVPCSEEHMNAKSTSNSIILLTLSANHTSNRGTYDDNDDYVCYTIKGVPKYEHNGKRQEKRGCLRRSSSCEQLANQLGWKDVKCNTCSNFMCNMPKFKDYPDKSIEKKDYSSKWNYMPIVIVLVVTSLLTIPLIGYVYMRRRSGVRIIDPLSGNRAMSSSEIQVVSNTEPSQSATISTSDVQVISKTEPSQPPTIGWNLPTRY